MTQVPCRTVIKSAGGLEPKATKRSGVTERVLLSREECPHQNVAIIDLAEHAVVEIHPSPTSESFYVLEGTVAMVFPDGERILATGDFCHMPGGVQHGVRAEGGAARMMVIFAPPAAKK